MTFWNRSSHLRIELDEAWAWGWIDLPIPQWLQRLLRIKAEVDNYRSGID
jgi:hypothetical protein